MVNQRKIRISKAEIPKAEKKSEVKTTNGEAELSWLSRSTSASRLVLNT